MPYLHYYLSHKVGIRSIKTKLYKNGLARALIFKDEIYFKVDGSNRADYQALDSKPFTYEKQGRQILIPNWSLPAEILEDSERLVQWTEKAYPVALKAQRK